MDYARQQRDPARHLIGITFVVLLHLLLIYAMVTGLARKAVEVIKKPLSATIIEEIKAPPPPPPPPPKKVVEQPKTQAPQETYVPPPDIPVATTTDAPVISATTTAAPTEPHVIAPPVVQAPPAPVAAKPAVRQGVSCHEMEKPTFPREARRAGVDKGEVNVLMQIDEKGNVMDVKIVSADPPKVFDRATHDALMNWKCKAEGEKYYATVQVGFRLE
jgi:protein TonB